VCAVFFSVLEKLWNTVETDRIHYTSRVRVGVGATGR